MLDILVTLLTICVFLVVPASYSNLFIANKLVVNYTYEWGKNNTRIALNVFFGQRLSQSRLLNHECSKLTDWQFTGLKIQTDSTSR